MIQESAMNNEGPVIVAIVFPFALAITYIAVRAGIRSQRLKVIEKAIESGRIDEETRRALLKALTPDSQWLTALVWQLKGMARNLLFVGGWVTMFAGIGVLIASETFRWGRDESAGGLIAAFVGFALVTLPLALREISRRNTADQPQ
jgi:hypothetical protein